MARLTDTQLVILSAAAKHTDGAVLPLPKSLKRNKGASANTIRSLIKRGLIGERNAAPDDVVWREEGDNRLSLMITEAGLAAIGIDQPETPSSAKPDRKGTKQNVMIDLLRRDGGASIDELSQALGWQAHSVRGAISGALKKKLGLTVMSEKHAERGRVYHIAAEG
ncbi:MAG: DUF3489 domain-containing protein [Alphaproteobacteria bacterium]|nr:DUF3489 domain-containing protein [Alphaproteobacteria bacterium]